MRFSAVSFDCAETLVQTDWHPAEMALACAKQIGLVLDETHASSLYTRLLQTRWRDYCRINVEAGTAGSRAWWKELTSDWLVQLGESTSYTEPLLLEADERLFGPNQTVFKLYEDTLPALQEMKDRSWRMLVVSNWDYSLPWVLDILGLSAFFEFAIPSLTVGVEKPDPKIFEIALSKLNLGAEEVVHVGDNPIDDVQGAIGAGLQAIHLDRAATEPRQNMVRSLSELPVLLSENYAG